MSKMINEDRLFSEVVKNLGERERIIEEVVENCMRVKAKNVVITLNPEVTELTISNDGPILSDFHPLLILADTSYSEETIRNNKPAGMGIMMIIAASKTVVFTSGNQEMTVESDLFFGDKEYRESRFDSIAKNESYLDGFMIKMTFDKPQEWIKKRYNSHRHIFSGIQYQYGLNIYMKADFVEIEEPLNNEPIDFMISKTGEGILSGATIGIQRKACAGNDWYKNGELYWHGKRIESKSLYPFVIHVTGDFNALQPRLPDRTILVNSETEITEVKREIERQLKNELQDWFYTKDGESILHVLRLLNETYNVDHFTKWGTASKDLTQIFFVCDNSEADIYINGEKSSSSECELLEIPDEIDFGSLMAGKTKAPEWVLKIAEDERMPKVEITRSQKAIDASCIGTNWGIRLCESIKIEGHEVGTILTDYDVAYFTKDSDTCAYVDLLENRYDNSNRDQLSDEVESDVSKILHVYSGSANLYEALQYARELLRAHTKSNGINITSITVDVKEGKISILYDEDQTLSLPLE